MDRTIQGFGSRETEIRTSVIDETWDKMRPKSMRGRTLYEIRD